MNPESMGCASCQRETDKALLIRIQNLSDQEFWIPKVCIHDDSEVYKADSEGELVVTRWFAETKGWV